MKKFIFVILMLLVSFSVFADQIDLLSSYWDFYSQNHIDYYSLGLGMSTISELSPSNISFQNPASIDVDVQSISISTSYKNEIALSDTLKLKGRLPILYAAYSIDLKKIADFSFGYENSKSFQIINSYENENYLKDKKLFYKETAYFFSNSLKKFKFFRLGYSIYINSIQLTEDTQTAYIDRFQKNFFSYKFGMIVIPIKNLQIGATFSPKTKFKITVLNSDDETFSTNRKTIPEKIKGGISYKYKNFATYYQLDYEKTSDDFYLKNDKISHHVGFSLDYHQKIKFLSGFFTNNCSYKYESYDIAPNLPALNDEFFVTLGVVLHDENLSLGLSLADSHFSNASTPKTYISLGFSYSMISLF